MSVNYRIIAISGGVALLVAGALASPVFFPAALAEDAPRQVLASAKDMFAPPKFDPKTLRKFDIVLDDSVSTEVTHQAVVTKIGFGKRTIVSIVTTPSGTYSSDAIGSPYVRYPGVDVAPADDIWPSGQHDRVRVSSSESPWGKSTSISVQSGSFTYYKQVFTPAPGQHRHRIW